MDDNKTSQRVDPSQNPFNQSKRLGTDAYLDKYDDHGNRIGDSNKKPPFSGSLTEFNADALRSDLIKENIPQNEPFVKGVDLTGIEPASSELSGPSVYQHQAHEASIPEKPKSAPDRLILPKAVMIAGIAAICIVGGLGVGFLWNKYQTKVSESNKILGKTANLEVESIVNKVGKLVELPKNEKPEQIASVSDVKKLGTNPFFANAQEGDIVLIYTANKQAILYRPSTNKIVATGPLNLSGKPEEASVAGATTSALPTSKASSGSAR